jgi:hypothetical protein
MCIDALDLVPKDGKDKGLGWIQGQIMDLETELDQDSKSVSGPRCLAHVDQHIA